MRSVLAAIAVALLPASVLAQGSDAKEREAILATVQKFFDSIATRDAAAARSVLVLDGRIVSAVDGEGPARVRSRTFQEFVDGLGTGNQKFLERFWNPEVRIQGPIAVVWTPYDFWIDGKFSHCGIDAFDMVKTPEGWKISGGVYTVQREGCAPGPLGPPRDGE